MNTVNLTRVWGVAVVTTVLAVIPYVLLGVVRRVLVPWSASISTTERVPTSTAGPWRRLAAGIAWGLGSIGVVFIGWYAYLWVFDLSPFVGKTPRDVWEFVVTDPDASQNRATLWAGLRTTTVHALVGYIAGLIAGVLAAVVFVLSPLVERVLTPLAVALRSVPIVVLTPVLILALGRGLWGVVAITAIVTFFPTLANTQTGLQRVPADALVLMRSYHASTVTALLRVQIPYALPSIFAAARIAAPTAILAATLAEWLATGNGLGHAIVLFRVYNDYQGLWAATVLLTIMSVLFYSAVSWAERLVLRRYAPHHLT